MRIFFTLLLISTILNVDAQVEIYGTAKNYKDSVFYISENGSYHFLTMAWRDNRVKFTIDKNGNFKATVPEYGISTWCIRSGKNTQSFDLVKNRTLQLIADFSKEYPLEVVGKDSADFNYNRYIDKHVRQYYKEENYIQKSRIKNIDSALTYRKEFSNFKMKLLNEYRRAHPMSADYYRYLSNKYTYEPFERMTVENIKRDSVDDVTVSKIMEKGINDEYAALHTNEYNDLISFYIGAYLKKNINGAITMNDRFSVVADGNLLKGSTKDVYLTRLLAGMIKVPDSIYNPLFSKYDKIVHNKQLKESVISRRYDYTNPAHSSILSAASLGVIFGKYKGKVIYVDFWASWCVPCRNEMPNSAELKKNLKGKDIVFIYFGYKDQENAWLKAREQLGIEGEHYLLNETLIKEANGLFEVTAIPHYAIIDKAGNIINKNANRPGAVYNQLLNLLQQ